MDKQRLDEIKALLNEIHVSLWPYLYYEEGVDRDFVKASPEIVEELVAEVERLQETQAQLIAENTKMMTAIRERDILLAMSKPK